MKKILFAAVAALAITGCSQNEEIEKAAKTAEIGFNTVVKTTTRVTPLETDNFTAFHVYGYNIGETEVSNTSAFTTPLIANGSSYTRTDKNTSWAGDTYYWPASATDKLCFFAYSPELLSPDVYAVPNNGYPTLSYAIQGVGSQEDLVIAKATNLLKEANTGGVSLVFAHALTQINFSVKLTQNFTYKITEIKIENVANEGTLGFENTTWTSQTGSEAYIYNVTYNSSGYNPKETSEESSEKTVDFSTADNALMLLPQSFDDSSTAAISVTYTVTASNGQTTFTGTKKVALKNSTAWGEGKKIRYTLTLPTGADAISFTPTVGGWTDDSREESAK